MANFYDFASPDRKARHISSTETFQTEIVYTPEVQKRLRQAAGPNCVICLGRGFYNMPDKGWQMCLCLDV